VHHDDVQVSALTLAARLRRREISAVEVTRQYLDVIERKNPEIQAFVQLDERRALRAAEQADRRLAGRGELPLFLGVPSGIKDHEHMRWMKTRAGSRALSWVVSPFDSLLARRCREGGMVLIGKLSTSELTILPFVHTDWHPPTRNPVDTKHYAGGSSGGSAAAVAARMLPIAPGSDGAGSIRLPASFCDLVGIKPGRGVLFHEHGLLDMVEISAVGPIAQNVKYAAALLDVLDGRSMHTDRPQPGSFLAACDERPRSLKIKLCLDTPFTKVHADVERAVRRAGKKLEELGHHVEESTALEGSVEEFLPLMARMARGLPLPPFSDAKLQPTTRWIRAEGKGVSKAAAIQCCGLLEKKVLEWFGPADVHVMPTCAHLPPRVGQYDGLDGEGVFRAVVPLGAFTAPFNASGQPALSLPAGRSANGLPMGVQLVGRRGRDAQLIGLAAALEEALA
jgi:amidase